MLNKTQIPGLEIEFLELCHLFPPTSFIAQAKTRMKYKVLGEMLSPQSKTRKAVFKVSHTQSAWIFKGQILRPSLKILKSFFSSRVLTLNLTTNI